jgi:hypothetical protein
MKTVSKLILCSLFITNSTLYGMHHVKSFTISALIRLCSTKPTPFSYLAQGLEAQKSGDHEKAQQFFTASNNLKDEIERKQIEKWLEESSFNEKKPILSETDSSTNPVKNKFIFTKSSSDK